MLRLVRASTSNQILIVQYHSMYMIGETSNNFIRMDSGTDIRLGEKRFINGELIS